MTRITQIFLLVFAPALAILLALLGLGTLQANPLGWFLLMVGVIYAVGVMIAYYVRKERFWESSVSEAAAKEERGDYSFWLFTAGMVAAFYLPPVEYLYFAPILPRTGWLSFSGAVLVIMGIALFIWARRSLGKNYSGHLSVQQGQALVQSGPYRLLRHPAYAGFLLMALGLGVGYSSIAGLVAILALLLPGLNYRMNVEEKLLSEHFGQAYREYARRTKRLIPGIW